MSGRFFITGLPRSRTAWFSVATTTPTSVCFHEPEAARRGGLAGLWAPKLGVDIGISDSSLAPQVGRVLDEFSPRTLIIHRDIESAVQSFSIYAKNVGINSNLQASREFARQCAREISKVRTHPLVKHVGFHELNDYETVLSCLQWLLPGREFPDLRFLMGMNIQVSGKRIREALAAEKAA